MSLASFDTIYPADSVEFCPTHGFQDIFACGTYNLLDDQGHSSETSKQSRVGQCLLFRVKESDDGDNPILAEKIKTIDLPAIPDMKWSHGSSAPTLAVADSEGSITVMKWQEDNLHLVQSIRCTTPDTLCLSLDWSNRRSGGSNEMIVASLSNGELCLLGLNETTFQVQKNWHAHDFEPWVAAWDYWNRNIIYSGGDDVKLKAWDIRQGFLQPTVSNKRQIKFEAGITSIQSHPHREHILAVGSYDNTVRIFDSRKLTTPIALADVGGGAWRVKWHPSETRQDDLLVACMHGGFKVVSFNHEGGSIASGQVVRANNSHNSLAYGADWSFAPQLKHGNTLVGSCSFYDHTLSIWRA